VFPGFGTIVGLAFGSVVALVTNLLGGPSNEEKLDYYYSAVGQTYTGLLLSKDGDEQASFPTLLEKAQTAPDDLTEADFLALNKGRSKITSKQDLTLAFDAIYDRYLDIMNDYYSLDVLPPVTPLAYAEFRKIPGYEKRIEENNYAVSVFNNTITRLADLKDKLDTLRPADASVSYPNYSTYLPHINEFSRLSSNMVTGNEIAKVDNQTQEYIAQLKYIWDVLLKGDNGCEKQIADGKMGLVGPLKTTKRATYPFKIWYEYGTSDVAERNKASVSVLSDYGITEVTNQAGLGEKETGGPGFLSNVAFSYNERNRDGCNPDSTNAWCSTNIICGSIAPLPCIEVADLFIHINTPTNPIWVGRKTGTNQADTSFEQTIGIY